MSLPPFKPPPPPPILGSFFIGNILSSVLFGAITVQTWVYLNRFRKDSWVMKTMVWFLWLAQFAEVAISTRAVYRQTIKHLVTPPPPVAELANNDLEWDAQYWSTHLIVASFIVQSFFAYRLWALSRYRIYVATIALLISTSFAVAVDDNKNTYALDDITPDAAHHSDKVFTVTSLSVVIDLAIAFGVTDTMRRQRTGFIQTDRVLNWIILYGIASGVLTSIFAIGILAANALGDGPKSLGVGAPYGGIYIASALANLNSRAGLRSQLAGENRLPTDRTTWPSLEITSPSSYARSKEQSTTENDVELSVKHPSVSNRSSMRKPHPTTNESRTSTTAMHVSQNLDTIVEVHGEPPGADDPYLLNQSGQPSPSRCNPNLPQMPPP
ncbi:hypothetical protein DL93DRAFT_2163160 [Clavulina sp. PMI_390]|nr:hypothetical protein DL93DRAFT_2163160 [Clavulina sp. PMI_390]